MLEQLLERFRHHDRRALARLLTLLSRGESSPDILSRLPPPGQPALVVAITGSAGVGKSSLVGRLLEVVRSEQRNVAVLACDPQSPLSGGALLGDRFRMTARPEDEGIFIRSLAAVGGHDALAEHLDDMIRLLEAYGFEVVLLETVGAGQGDTAVRHLADVVVVLLQTETGDDLQWEKAGVLEVADVLVLHKADLPGSDQVEAQVRAMLSLGSRPAPPLIRVSSRTGQGLAELWQIVSSLSRRRQSSSPAEQLIRLIHESLSARFETFRGRPEWQELLVRWHRGELTISEAVTALCQFILGTRG